MSEHADHRRDIGPVQRLAPTRSRRTCRSCSRSSILGGLTLLYIGLFHGQLDAFPGMFEWTSVVNTAVPTVLVAVGQTIVVITRGIDLSVGGVIDLSNALAATHMKDSVASMVGWSLAILALGAAFGARQRDPRRLRPTPADPCHPGDARDPAGACAPDAPRAGRPHPTVLLEHARERARAVEPPVHRTRRGRLGWSCAA